MSPKVQSRRDAIINVVFIAMVLGLVYVFFKYLFGFLAPFLLSFLFAVALQKPLRFLDKKTKNKCHSLLSIALVLALILVIIGPVVLVLVLVGKEIAGFISYLTGQLNDFPNFLATLQKELLDFLKFLPDAIYTTVSDSITDFFGRIIENFDLSALNIDLKAITSGISSGISGMISVAKNIPSIALGTVIGIIAWIFFTKDYDKIVGFIKLQLPEGKKNLLSDIKQVFAKTVLKMLRAYGIIMLITFFELFLGLTILNLLHITENNYVVIIAIAIAIFDILPVAGSGGILVPWMLVSLVLGNTSTAIGLLIIYLVITVIRQYIEPKIVGDSLGVHPIITLAGLYFGLKLFGFIGMFVVPLTVMTLKAFNDAGRIHLYKSPSRN